MERAVSLDPEFSFAVNMVPLDRRAVSQRMKALGYRNISDFSARTGIHRNTVLEYFRGKSVFAAAFMKLARALGRDPIDLIVPAPSSPATSPAVEEIRPIVARLLRLAPGVAVVLLGSRARGKPAEYSDWDIGIFRPSAPLSSDEFLALRRAAADLAEDLVRGVDLVNLTTLDTKMSFSLEQLVLAGLRVARPDIVIEHVHRQRRRIQRHTVALLP